MSLAARTKPTCFVIIALALLSTACGSAQPASAGDAGSAGAAANGGSAGAGGASAAGAAGASLGGAAGSAGAPAGCTEDGDCACGRICAAGSCAPGDCSDTACPTDRTCTCAGGILSIDGATGPQWAKLGDTDVVLRRRPMTNADDGQTLALRNYRVHDATNQKGLHVTLAHSDGQGVAAMYAAARIQCVEIANVFRDAFGAQNGLHMDYIKIDGGLAGKAPADVLLEDIHVHDGNVYSLISDAQIAQLVLRRVRHENTQGALQIGGHNAGYIDQLTIDQSPDLRIALLDSKLGRISIRASAGLTGTESQKDSVPISYDAESCPDRPLGTKECCELGGKLCDP
jgi:hypothetical protein